MKFKDKKLLELAEFWNKDWETESPTLEDTNTMRLWEQAINTAARESSELEMLQALHELKDIDYLGEIVNLRERFFESFAFSLLEEMKQLKISVEVLLKEHENEPARITIGQLNRLKRGI